MRSEDVVLSDPVSRKLITVTLGDPQFEADCLELGFRVASWLAEENEDRN